MVRGDTVSLAKIAGPTAYDAADEERTLVEAASAGDDHAFDTLVDLHWRKIASIASRFLQDPHEAEDVVQETFIRAFERLKSFRGQSGFQTWLIRIAINQCKNRQQSFWKRRVFLQPEETSHTEPSSDSGGEAALMQGEASRAVQNAVRKLPEKYRLPIVLHYFEDLTGAEVAAVLGWKESLVWSRIYAGYRELRKRLTDWNGS